MTDLSETRARLDEIDRKLSELYLERLRLCADVAEYKISTGKPVYDPEREAQKIASVRETADDAFGKDALEALYRHIMETSRKYQHGLLEKAGVKDGTGAKA